MPVSKSVRFSIFARDQFTCQYCGRRPPDVVLEVDHIHPVSRDGDDDPLNLVTACFECNRGKAAKVLSQIPRKPDADLVYLEAQQEIAEAKRYLDAKKKRDKIWGRVAMELEEVWFDMVTSEMIPGRPQFQAWVRMYGADETEEALRIVSPKAQAGHFGPLSDSRNSTELVRYVSGILRKRFARRPEYVQG